MANFTGKTKHSSAFTNLFELGASWIYNNLIIEYSQETFEGKPLLYNSVGITNILVNKTKHSSAFTNKTKN